LRGYENSKEDIAKVLFIAYQANIVDWRSWVSERFDAARLLVETNWNAIEHTAKRIEKQLTMDGEQTVSVPGIQIIRAFRKHGVRTKNTPFVEVIGESDRASKSLRLVRWWMKGRNRLVVRIDSRAQDA